MSSEFQESSTDPHVWVSWPGGIGDPSQMTVPMPGGRRNHRRSKGVERRSSGRKRRQTRRQTRKNRRQTRLTRKHRK